MYAIFFYLFFKITDSDHNLKHDLFFLKIIMNDFLLQLHKNCSQTAKES